MAKVFLSFSSDDRAFAQWLKRALSQANIDTVLDDIAVAPGAGFASALRDEVRSADALLAILSEQAIARPNVLLEIGMAQGLGKRVIAVLAPGSKVEMSAVESLSDTYVMDAAKLKPPEL